MAVSSTTRASALGNPQSAFPTDPTPISNGLIQHVLVTAGAQVHLQIIDETGSAEIGDIAAGMEVADIVRDAPGAEAEHEEDHQAFGNPGSRAGTHLLQHEAPKKVKRNNASARCHGPAAEWPGILKAGRATGKAPATAAGFAFPGGNC